MKTYDPEKFTVDPKRWLENYWGFVPEEEDLLRFVKRESGTVDFFRSIFSEKYLVTQQTKAMNRRWQIIMEEKMKQNGRKR